MYRVVRPSTTWLPRRRPPRRCSRQRRRRGWQTWRHGGEPSHGRGKLGRHPATSIFGKDTVKKSLGLISAALVGMAALGACGSQDYCDVYQDSNEEFSDLDFAEMDGLDKPRDYAEQLRDTAPNDEIEDAWQDVEATFDGLRDALDDADMSFDDFKQDRKSVV